MSGGRNTSYPRSSVPSEVGARVRELRKEKEWSQERLARAVGVTRKTISRLEQEVMPHVPGADLVHALGRVFGQRLVKGWHDPPDEYLITLNARARLARRSAGLTLQEVSEKCGVGVATISRFERSLGEARRIVEPGDGNALAIWNDDYAEALGFLDAAEMDEYCGASDPDKWLRLIADRLAKG